MKDNDFEELWNSGATARKYRQCHISDQELETIIGKAIDRDNQTRQKHFTILKRPYLYPAMAVACVAAVVVGLWQLRINSVLIPNTPEALQPSTSLLAAQTTDTHIPNIQDHRPATITDNELKNTANQTADRHNYTMYAENNTATLPTADAPQPDTIATAPIEQEHIPMLLAETETQIEIEQNLVAIDTAIYNDNISDTMLVLQQNLSDYQEYKITYNDISNAVNSDIASFCSTMCMEKDVINTFDKTINYVL